MATVSRVVNGSGTVTEKSEKKVRDAIKELGYYSNELARGLTQGGLNAVGVVIPDIGDPYFSDMLRGIDDVLTPAGYTILFNNTDDDLDAEQQCLKNMRSMGLAGCLVFSCRADMENFDFLKNNPGIVVFLSGNEIEAGGNVIHLPFTFPEKIMCGISYLVQGGKKNPLICLSARYQGSAFVEELLQRIQEDYGIHAELCYSMSTLADSERIIGKKLLEGRFDGIVTGSDLQAYGAVHAAEKAGLEIPENVSLVSMGNTVLAAGNYLPLTCVGPSGYQIGLAGARCLLSALRNEGGSDSEEIADMVKPELIVRRS